MIIFGNFECKISKQIALSHLRLKKRLMAVIFNKKFVVFRSNDCDAFSVESIVETLLILIFAKNVPLMLIVIQIRRANNFIIAVAKYGHIFHYVFKTVILILLLIFILPFLLLQNFPLPLLPGCW